MKLLITGGSGTLGQKITKLALSKNYHVNILSRNKKLISNCNGLEYYHWDPSRKIIDNNCFVGVDSIINLSGFNVFCYSLVGRLGPLGRGPPRMKKTEKEIKNF